MAGNHTGNVQPSIDLEEHRSKNVNAKAVVMHVYDPNTDGYYPVEAVQNTDGSWTLSDPKLQQLLDLLGILEPVQRAIPYARDINQRMYVNVGAGSVTVGSVQLWAGGTYAGYYATTGAPNSIDQREQQQQFAKSNFQQVRLNRWVFS